VDMIGLIIYFSIALVIMRGVVLEALHLSVASAVLTEWIAVRTGTNAHFGYSASSWIAFSMPLTTIAKRS